MRVLVVSHLYPSTSKPSRGIFVAEQVGALVRMGLTVDVLSVRYSSDTPVYDAGAAVPTVHFVRHPWRTWIPSVFNVLFAAIALRRLIRAQLRICRYDVVHAHYALPDGAAAVMATAPAGPPVVVTLHGSDANGQLRRPFVGALLGRTLARAARVVCVSPAMPQLVRGVVGGCTIVPNGYNALDIAYAQHSQRDAVLFVGGLNPVKNPDVLLRAYAAAKNSLECDLLLAGDGSMASELRALAEDLGVSESVHFLGNVPHGQLGDLYSRAKIAVLPSASEGMPISALEALASGVPLVCTAVGALPLLVTDDVNGVLVQPGDVDALARALVYAVKKTWDRRSIAGDSRLLTWDEVAERLVGLYREVIGER